MRRKTRPGIYVVAIFIVIAMCALVFLRGAIIGYFTAVPSGPEEPVSGGTDFRGLLSSRGVTYVSNEVVDKFSRNGSVRVIIKFKNDIVDLNLNTTEFNKKRQSRVLFSGYLKNTGLVKLIDTYGDAIETIQVDHQLGYAINDTVPLIRADVVWESGFTGKGQTVCVVDTGIDYNHENLSGKYLGGYDFVNNDFDPMDDQGHGTFVSGIVAGIAPDAKIVAAKALGENGTGYESDIIAAIDYCIANKDLYHISVILLALGGGSFDGYCDAVLVTDESNYAVQQGMFVVAASGNDHSSNLTAPACGTNVTSVAATTKNDTFYPDNNINPLLDVLAPGVHITSTKLGGRFRIGSGTSASAAVVAGAAALILENESLEPLELQYRFRSTGVTMTYQGNNYTRIDAYNAINNIVTNTPSEQVGNQTNGTWKEYCPAGRYCTCVDWTECGSWEWCHPYVDCQNPEKDGECESCLGLHSPCSGEGDPACCPHMGRDCTYS